MTEGAGGSGADVVFVGVSSGVDILREEEEAVVAEFFEVGIQLSERKATPYATQMVGYLHAQNIPGVVSLWVGSI